MAAVSRPPSSGPTWLGEYTPPPKPTKPEKLPLRSKRGSRERRRSSTRPPPPPERKESVGGINVWAPPRTTTQDPEINPEPDSAPVQPAVNEIDSHTPNAMSAPEDDQMPVETAYASVDHITPHFDGLRADGGIPSLAHQEGMELPTGEHHINESRQQSATPEILSRMESIEAAEMDSSSLLSSDVSMVQGKDCSSLQEGQSHLQQRSQPCLELEQQNATFTSQTGESKVEDDQWQQEHVELKAEFGSFNTPYQQDTSQEFHRNIQNSGYDLSGGSGDPLDPWYTISPKNNSRLLLHRNSFHSGLNSNLSVEDARYSPSFRKLSSVQSLHQSPHSKTLLQSINASMEELPDIKIAEDSGCPKCGPFWSVELGALYSLLRGVYKDMGILQQAEAKKTETLIQENNILRNHLKEAVGHAKLLQHELLETTAILQSERSLANCQNLWLEEMREKDAGSLNASNLCELVEEQAKEVLAAQSTMKDLYGLLETKLSETPMKQENAKVQPKMHIAEDGLHLQDCSLPRTASQKDRVIVDSLEVITSEGITYPCKGQEFEI